MKEISNECKWLWDVDNNFFPVKSVFADDISILLVDLAVSQDSEHHKKWAR